MPVEKRGGFNIKVDLIIMTKLLIIDFDDCLCQTEEACFYLENDVAKQLGLMPMTRQVYQANWGKPIEEAISERLPGVSVSKFMSEFAIQLPKHIEQGTFDPISDSSLATLHRLHEIGIILVILTSRTRTEVAHWLDKRNVLSDIIDCWYYKEYAQEVCGAVKPDPQVMMAICQIHQTSPEQTMAIGDTPSDGVCANGAGVTFVASLESGLRKKSDFDHVKVDHFIQNFSEIEDVVFDVK